MRHLIIQRIRIYITSIINCLKRPKMLSMNEANAESNSIVSQDHRPEELEYIWSAALRQTDSHEEIGIWRQILEPLGFNTYMPIQGENGFQNTLRLNSNSNSKNIKRKAPKKQLLTKKNKEGNLQCSICFEKMKKGSKIPDISCGHFFHFRCLKRWSAQKDSCPMCRGPILQCSNNCLI